MCEGCARLVKAIDAYIRKADDSLADDLDAEGYAESRDTLEAARKIENGDNGLLISTNENFFQKLIAWLKALIEKFLAFFKK